MKSMLFKCNPLTHGWALQHLSTYLQDVGEKPGAQKAKIYGHKLAGYLVKIRQTKTQIVVEVL